LLYIHFQNSYNLLLTKTTKKAIKFYKARWQEMVKPYFDQNDI